MTLAALELDYAVPTAGQLRARAAIADAERLTEVLRKKAAMEVELSALISRFDKNSPRSGEDVLRRFSVLVSRPVTNAFSEITISRFRISSCSDSGSAIRDNLPGWETTLARGPKSAFDFWESCLKPCGYRLHIRASDGSPWNEFDDNARMTLAWN